jgi:hypothetical protein
VRLTIRHRYHFESARGLRELGSPSAWDEVRATGGAFGFPETREHWEEEAAGRGLERRAEAVVSVARARGARRLCSYGIGTGYLEKCIADAAPELELTCTDFALRAVERLAGYFPAARVLLHDLALDEPLQADLHLFNRLDTEFSDREWPAIFARFRGPVLVIATELIGPRTIVRELATLVRHPRATRAGWLRTEDSLCALWRATHVDERVGADLPAYLLTPR